MTKITPFLLLSMLVFIVSNVCAAADIPIKLLEPVQNDDGIWETNDIKMQFILNSGCIRVEIENKTNKPIKFNIKDASIGTRVMSYRIKDIQSESDIVTLMPRGISYLALEELDTLGRSFDLTLQSPCNLYIPITINGEVQDCVFNIVRR